MRDDDYGLEELHRAGYHGPQECPLCNARAAVVEAAKKWWDPDTGLDAGIELAQAVKDLCALEPNVAERCGGKPGKPEHVQEFYTDGSPSRSLAPCPGCRDCRPCVHCRGEGEVPHEYEYDTLVVPCAYCHGTGVDHA